MARLFTRVSLVSILGLVIAPIACADTIDMAQAGRSAMPGLTVSTSPFSRSSQVTPPLRLALALNREGWPGAVQAGESAQESITPPLAHAAALTFSAPARDTVFTKSDQASSQVPPLRLALALSREKLQPSEAVRDIPFKLAQQAGTVDTVNTPQQQRIETQESNTTPLWEISTTDRTLNATLARWSANAGWQLVWDMEVDYPIETRAVLQGTFQEAVAAVAQSLSGANVPVQATFYDGNKVLRIVAKGSK